MKKLITILCLLLSLTMLAGSCLAENTTAVTDATTDSIDAASSLRGMPVPELPLIDEVTTLTVLYPRRTNHGDFDTMWFLKQVEAQTNVKLEIQAIERAGWTEKKNLTFLSGDYSDIYLAGLNVTEVNQLGMSGVLQPLEELIAQHAPNVQAILDAMPDALKDLTASDGHIYMIPAFDTPARDMVHKVSYINEAWLTNLGLEMPSTLDELYECLVAFRDNDANGNGDPTDEIPLSFVYSSSAQNACASILTAFGFCDPRSDMHDGKYIYVPMHENFRHYLSFLNKLYEENLLDHEVFTQTAQQYNAKISSYVVGMESTEVSALFPEQEKKLEYNLVGPLTSEYNSVKMWPLQSSAKIGNGTFAITDKCQDPVLAIKLLDYFMAEDTTFMIKCGPEKGQWDGEGGWTRIIAEDGTNSYTIEYDSEKYNSFSNFRQANGLMYMPFLYTDVHAKLVLGGDAWGNYLSHKVFERGLYDARRDGYPVGATFTEDEQDVLATYVLLDNYVAQMFAKFVTGVEDINDDAAWEQYLATIDAYDVQTKLDTYQTAYDRWNQN